MDRHYQIPCNSTVQLGIIYNPRVKNEIFFFEKVSDIIQSQDLPKVITCTKRCKGRDGGSGVNPDEVLIVIEVRIIIIIIELFIMGAEGHIS